MRTCIWVAVTLEVEFKVKLGYNEENICYREMCIFTAGVFEELHVSTGAFEELRVSTGVSEELHVSTGVFEEPHVSTGVFEELHISGLLFSTRCR